MTTAQRNWLDAHPNYQAVGRPRQGVQFTSCGTLYADGTFELLAPTKPVMLREGCFAVGIRIHPKT